MNLLYLIRQFLLFYPLLVVAMIIHEFSHGWVAFKLGDKTAKYSGRLTFNPLAHIDPIWTFLMPLILFTTSGGRFIFGAAKPVPINYWALSKPKRDIILVGAAGPFANFLLAAALAVIINFVHLPEVIYLLIVGLININVILGVFNLIPVPPLDGSRILAGLLPGQTSSAYMRIEPYGFVILVLLMASGIISGVIFPVIALILNLLRVPFY